jgi:acyl dehydratase
MMEAVLAPVTYVRGAFLFGEDDIATYLAMVGGGHPVHSSQALAQRAGLRAVPVPGVLVTGAAVAVLGRHFSGQPMALVDVQARFRAPIAVGAEVRVTWTPAETSPLRAGRRIVEYVGLCQLVGDETAAELSARIQLSEIPPVGD